MLRISHVKLVAKRKFLLALLTGLVHSIFTHLTDLYRIKFGSFANCWWHIQIRRGKSCIIRANSKVYLRNSSAFGFFLIFFFFVVLLFHNYVTAALLNSVEFFILRLSSIHRNEIHWYVEGASASQNFMLLITNIYRKVTCSIEKLCIFSGCSKDGRPLSWVTCRWNKGTRAHCDYIFNVATLRRVLVCGTLINYNWGRCSLIQKLCRTLLSYR